MSAPRRVKVELTRSVTEIVVALLDKDGNIEEIEDVCEELSYDDCEIHRIISIFSVHS